MPIKPITVRGVTLGEGMPKICVPIVGQTREEILQQAQMLVQSPADVAEWRCDWFQGIELGEQIARLLTALRTALGDKPLLFTYRTQAEGGEGTLPPERYLGLLKFACTSGCIDLVDVELSLGAEISRQVRDCAHAHGVSVILSSHDFRHTPPRKEMISRLRRMQELGADVAKLAVMPRNAADVSALLSATAFMHTHFAQVPLITMSMSKLGAVSRLAGETFGSAMTFGALGESSAPGQLPVEEMKAALELLHRDA